MQRVRENPLNALGTSCNIKQDFARHNVNHYHFATKWMRISNIRQESTMIHLASPQSRPEVIFFLILDILGRIWTTYVKIVITTGDRHVMQDRSHQWSTQSGFFPWYYSFMTGRRTDNQCRNSNHYRHCGWPHGSKKQAGQGYLEIKQFSVELMR